MPRTLNRQRDFGQIFGGPGDAVYIQDGVLFDGQGRQCNKQGYTLPEINEDKTPPADPPAAAPEPEDEVEDELAPKAKTTKVVAADEDEEGAVALPKLKWSSLRVLAISSGADKSMSRKEMENFLGFRNIKFAREE